MAATLAMGTSVTKAQPTCVTARLAVWSIIAQPNSSLADERQVADLLKRARAAGRAGNLDVAYNLLDRAQRLSGSRSTLFQPFGDTPEKVRRDLDRMRSSSARPSDRQIRSVARGVTETRRPVATGSSRGSFTDHRRAAQPLDSLVENKKAKAQRYLEKGRAALLQRNTLSAIDWYQRAAAIRAEFGPREYSPAKLAEDLRRAGVSPNQLSRPAGRTQQPAFAVRSPNDSYQSMADRITPTANTRVGRFASTPSQPHVERDRRDRPFSASSRDSRVAPRDTYRRPLRREVSREVPGKREAVALLARAEAALDRNDLAQAKRLVMEAKRLRVPDSAFGPRDPNPGLLQMTIESRERRYRDRNVMRTSGVEPLRSDNFRNRANPERFPVSRALHRPGRDTTRNVAVANTEPATQSGMELFRLGEKALVARETEKARSFFQRAWALRDQLDGRTRQQLQDRLQVLQLSSHRPRPVQQVANTVPKEVNAEQQRIRQEMYREVARGKSAAGRLRKSDPLGAFHRLQSLRARVTRSRLDKLAKKQLLGSVDRSIKATKKYIDAHRAELDANEANKEVLDDLDRKYRVQAEIQQQLATITQQFNQLVDQRRLDEAILLARRAKELDPDNPLTVALVSHAKFMQRYQRQMDIKERAEGGFVNALSEVDEAGIPHSGPSYRLPDLRDWTQLSARRRELLRRHGVRMTRAEANIRRALERPVNVKFDKQPLSKVLDVLSNIARINIHIDPKGLAEEGITSNTLVSFSNSQEEISLKSVLHLILKEHGLNYVIQDEVLLITSDQIRDSEVTFRVYNVADLVIPIPNFVPTYDIGLPGAIRAAHNALGYGAMGSAAGSQSPMPTFASTGRGTSSASVLANRMTGPGSSPRQAGQPAGFGPGGMGGGSGAGFDSLIDLITSTIAPPTWDTVGGPGSIARFDTNLSLVISNTQEVHEQIVDLLKQLRRLQDLQVTIEVRFITLRDDFYERIGVDFDFNILSNSPNPLPTRGAGSSVTVGLDPSHRFTADLDLQFSQGGFATALPQFGGFAPAEAANFGFAILSDIEAFFLIQAAQGDKRANLLEAPKVTLFNGQQAFLSDTSQRPFVTGVVPVVGDFAAAHQPIVVVLSEGTSLSVQAVVSQDRRFVRLTLVPFFSKIGDVQEFTFEGKTSGNTGTAAVDPTDNTQTTHNDANHVTEGTTVQLPVFSYFTVTTTVSVPDGGTVLLGGIKRLKEGRTERGVPVLNKLPYINRLFRNVGIGRETESLMLMVTPRIIIPEEEEEKIGMPPPP